MCHVLCVLAVYVNSPGILECDEKTGFTRLGDDRVRRCLSTKPSNRQNVYVLYIPGVTYVTYTCFYMYVYFF